METRHKHIVKTDAVCSVQGYSGHYIGKDAMEIGEQTDESAKESEGSRK